MVDTTGRDRIFRNVLASWTGHLVFVAAGFIMPHMIDNHIGQAELGIWDFSWSLVNYFHLAGIGIGSAVNRFVAKCIASQDTDKLNRIVSSVWVIQIIAGMVIAMGSLTVAWQLPYFFGEKLGDNSLTAQLVVLLLGFNVAVQMALDSYRGVVTGCHRWDIHNFISSAEYLLIVLGMIIALVLGGHLVSMSVVYLCGTILGESARVWITHRICPQLKIRIAYFSWKRAGELFQFGLKGVIGLVYNLVIIQGTSILVASFLGPAALAILSRPLSLIRHSETIVNKFALVLTPTAGSMQGSGNDEGVRDLYCQSARLGAFLSLPILLFMSILGDPILGLWMGERYEHGVLMSILSVGFFLPISLQSVFTILTGLNLHGKVGITSSGASIAVFGIGVLVLPSIGWDLNKAAALIAISATVGVGIIRPIYGCSKLGISPVRFFITTFMMPIFCNLPFLVCLIINRELITGRPLVSVVTGAASAAILLVPIYWRAIVPNDKRTEIQEKIIFFFRKASGSI